LPSGFDFSLDFVTNHKIKPINAAATRYISGFIAHPEYMYDLTSNTKISCLVPTTHTPNLHTAEQNKSNRSLRKQSSKSFYTRIV